MVYVATCNSCPFLSFSFDKKDNDGNTICYCSLTKETNYELIIPWKETFIKINEYCPLRTDKHLEMME